MTYFRLICLFEIVFYVICLSLTDRSVTESAGPSKVQLGLHCAETEAGQSPQLQEKGILESIIDEGLTQLGSDVELASDAEIGVLSEVLISNSRFPIGPCPSEWIGDSPCYQTYLVLIYSDSPGIGQCTSNTVKAFNWTLKVDRIGMQDRSEPEPRFAVFVTSYATNESNSGYWVGASGAYAYSLSSRQWHPCKVQDDARSRGTKRLNAD